MISVNFGLVATMAAKIQLDDSWLAALGAEFEKQYMKELRAYLLGRKRDGAVIYPEGANWFAALNATPLERVKVVILGQDPYHGPGQAHGLCFSVKPEVSIPPSLVNIYKELHDDIGFAIPNHGHLDTWARRGVLLLNSVLTVERGRAAAHQGRGWEQFTDAVIALVNRQREGVVFMLWGSYAQKKGAHIDRDRHLVLSAPHPSPLSAYRGFFGCRHFSQANDYLGERALDWSLPAEL